MFYLCSILCFVLLFPLISLFHILDNLHANVEIQYSNGSVDAGHKLNGVACTVGTTHHNPRQSFGSYFAIIQTSPAGLIALDTIHVPMNNGMLSNVFLLHCKDYYLK